MTTDRQRARRSRTRRFWDRRRRGARTLADRVALWFDLARDRAASEKDPAVRQQLWLGLARHLRAWPPLAELIRGDDVWQELIRQDDGFAELAADFERR